MKKHIYVVLLLSAVFGMSGCKKTSIPSEVKMDKEVLLDKIKGGWAGQMIGCTYGGPTEFKWPGMYIQDYTPIEWPDGLCKWYYEHAPALYDDIFMDLTFVKVIDRLGIEAPADSFAVAFAKEDYGLAHANAAARALIRGGMMPPATGFWKNNPHADDIDYQIECDYAGLMNPGMPNNASEISDKIGHIMNYGDGWYGGVYIGAMYTLAFCTDDIEYVVTEALKAIPAESKYYRCISDVIKWCKENPDNWHRTWNLVQENYAEDIGCPDGVFVPFDIDATINSAYVVMGLLYGKGDFYKTMDIATRCGSDSDCNPASACGVLGTILGYKKIPEKWMKNLHEVEADHLAYVNMSMNEAYEMSYKHALMMIERSGGQVKDKKVVIKTQQPQAVRLEQGFEGLYPVASLNHHSHSLKAAPCKAEFAGTGIVTRYRVVKKGKDYEPRIAVTVDGQQVKEVVVPSDYRLRSSELYMNYDLKKGDHVVEYKWTNPVDDVDVIVTTSIVYSDGPSKNNP